MTGTWTLPMTADEIGEMYRTAKSKAKEVGILAELNATSKERIVAILTEAGFQVDGRATRYLKTEGKDTSSVTAEAVTPSPQGEGLKAAKPPTHTHTPRAARPEPITVGRLREVLARLPVECEVCLGEDPMQGYSYAKAVNLLSGEERQIVQLV